MPASLARLVVRGNEINNRSIVLKNPTNASTPLSMNGNFSDHFGYSSVRPEALEG